MEPHSLEGDPGSIYLWVETLDEGNRPSGVPRAYRIPYRDSLAEKTDKAMSEIAAGRPQGGRAADFGSGEGGLIEAVREYITPNAIMETSGGDPSTGGGLIARPALATRCRLRRCSRRDAAKDRSNVRLQDEPAGFGEGACRPAITQPEARKAPSHGLLTDRY